jgi:tRNA A-37 threonylcarbamoyl transferase component Bud32
MNTESEPKQCPNCGEPVPPEAPQGLCPKCLLAELSIPTEAGQAQRAKEEPPGVAELAAAFPQLEILELIGQGGMGFVFKARQPKLDRIVALKILPQGLAADPAFAERFTREGRLLARLSHPNIVAVHDFGQANGFFYLLMEFVDGVNLRQAMKAGRFTADQALAIVPKICEALQFAHNDGILHRDIKPENILLDTKGRVKIADFGIAKLIDEVKTDAALTAREAAIGTPHYMAPEQFERTLELDHRADIFSLGVVFYELLTGELPLGRFAPPSEKSDADPRLDEIVMRALAKEREQRQQSATEMKTQVETVATSTGGKVRKPRAAAPALLGYSPSMPGALPRQRVNPWTRRLFWLIAVALFVPLFLIAIYLLAPMLTMNQEPPVQDAPPPSASVAEETWAPSTRPGEQPDPSKVLDEARELTIAGRYEEALQRHIWYHNHALKYGAGLSAVRLSFALAEWRELGRRYPKAKQALMGIRDHKTRTLAEGGGYSDQFQDVSSINSYLQEDDASYALFMTIHKQDPGLARQCYWFAEKLLVQKGQYQLCLGYIGDHQIRFQRIRESWEQERKFADTRTQQFENQPQRASAELPNLADNRFVEGTRRLIEILVGSGYKAEAEKMREQAIALLDDPRLKSAVEDAEERVRQ